MKDFIVKYWLEVIFGGIVAALSVGYKKLSARQKRQGLIENAMQALLRDRIIETYTHYREKSKCPIYALENVHALYDNYHALGGNGTVTKLVEELEDMAH